MQTHIFQPAPYTHSTYSTIIFKGASSLNSYKTLEDALDQLTSHILTKEHSPAYYLLYYDKIDAAGHISGPRSQHFAERVDHFFLTLEQLFYRKLHSMTGDTLLLIVADHGQIEVSPRKTCYLNHEMPEIARYLKNNRRGDPLVPAGSARDMFLHIKEELLAEALAFLRQSLAGRADIYPISELIDQNFFGSTTPSAVFLARVGNVVILPHPHESVWWYEKDRFDMHFLGNHGGLTPEEMEIPLLALPL